MAHCHTSKEVEVANTLNNFFSTIIKSLKIPEYYAENNLPPNLSRHPTLKAILKYKSHPSISIIKRFSELFSSFHFSQVDKNTVLKEITKLSLNKSVQDTDIPVKILKENADYFAEHIAFNLMRQYVHQNSQHLSNLLTYCLYSNNVLDIRRITIDQSTSYQSFQKYLKNFCEDNFQIILIIFFRSFNAVLENAIAHSIVYFY